MTNINVLFDKVLEGQVKLIYLDGPHFDKVLVTKSLPSIILNTDLLTKTWS